LLGSRVVNHDHAHAAATSDPAEATHLRWFYRDWRPTRLGRWINRMASWLLGLGLSSRAATLETRGRLSGAQRVTPVVIARVDGKRYLVSILGAGSDWVKNVDAARGAAVLRQGRRRPVQLVCVPPRERAPILREYVRVATSGREHFPVKVGAPLSEFEAIAERYPVYQIDPADARGVVSRRWHARCSSHCGSHDLGRPGSGRFP
jgi:deazaflavin-dependent oxidoreductase (nitroreductase family)